MTINKSEIQIFIKISLYRGIASHIITTPKTLQNLTSIRFQLNKPEIVQSFGRTKAWKRFKSETLSVIGGLTKWQEFILNKLITYYLS